MFYFNMYDMEDFPSVVGKMNFVINTTDDDGN